MNLGVKKINITIIIKIYVDKIHIYLSEFAKRYLQKFQVRFNNLTVEVNKKQLKVAS